MSVWRTGTTFASSESMARVFTGQPTTAKDIIGRIVTWIPGDIIVLYAGAVTALSAKATPGSAYQPSPWLLVGFVVAAFVYSLGASFAESGTIAATAVRAAVAAMVATALWAFTIPASGWYALDFFNDNQPFAVIIAAVVAGAFGFLADGLVKLGWLPPP